MIKSRKQRLKKAFIIILCLGVAGIVVLVGINVFMTSSVSDRIISTEEAAKLEDVDCIIVLGCLVREDGTPSHLLEDRIKRGIELYHAGASPKIIMSGDHGREGYNEVATMKEWAINGGVPSSDVFMDHAGFSTYESVYRAREIFGADKVIIVTQEYHLYRALYIAKELGVEAYGVAADYRKYAGQIKRDVRELLARVKVFGFTILKPEPTYLGDSIPVSGDGDITND